MEILFVERMMYAWWIREIVKYFRKYVDTTKQFNDKTVSLRVSA